MKPLLESSRREWLLAAGAASAAMLTRSVAAAPAKARPRVAAVFTELRFRSHAYNILENFFQPYLFRGELVDPGCDVVSFYADQFPKDDMARGVSQRFKIPLYKTIDEALCVGGKSLAVDAVLLIGEHGDYPYNEMGQHLYPRKPFFDQCVRTMERAGRFVPLFNDKHLSYRWDWAREMFDTARAHKMPFQAGSSVPLAQRLPGWELPAGAEIEEAVSIHGGGLESYDFHAFEVLQAIVESRRSGESGVKRIEFFEGDALEAAKKAGRWSVDLFDAAMQAERDVAVSRQQRPSRSIRPNAIQGKDDPSKIKHAIAVEYRDGLRATVFAVGGAPSHFSQPGGNSSRWNFACRLKGAAKPQALAHFNGPWGNRCLFKALSHAIQHLFTTGQEPYPLERTLLTTGLTEAAVQARHAKKAIDTPHLAIAYQVGDWQRFRENGASWQRLTAESPQPEEFEPGDAKLLQK
ncbi:MAG: hypothetical protein JNM18_00435 [Planctomycetaceae bacterium]|nr:hypothetical protein [Planctomycetaceae bacterium]